MATIYRTSFAKNYNVNVRHQPLVECIMKTEVLIAVIDTENKNSILVKSVDSKTRINLFFLCLQDDTV